MLKRAVLVLFFSILSTTTANAVVIQYGDVAHSSYATGISGIDLNAFGFGQYDLFFVSNREQTINGWNALASVYSSFMSPDIFPNVANSEELAHLLKREIVRNFNDGNIGFVSGLVVPSSTSYEYHDRFDEQNILLVYRSLSPDTVEGTFASRNPITGEWGTNDLVGNMFSNHVHAGSNGYYWAVVTSVPEPTAFCLIMLGYGAMLYSRRRRNPTEESDF